MLASARFPAATIPILNDGAGPWVAPRRSLAFAPACVAISRSLCKVYFFKPSAPLSPSELANAAWLFAEGCAPVSNVRSLVLKHSGGAEIWQWDDALIRAKGQNLKVRSDICFVPESILQAPGDGWRQVQTAYGYEAQFWRSGELQASLWRRNPFTDQQWRAFALASISQSEPFPAQPPAPQSVPMSGVGEWRRRVLHKDGAWRQVEKASVLGAVAAFAFAAYAYGQALGATLEANRADAPQLSQLELDRAVADAHDLAAISSHRPDVLPVAALADARTLANTFGITLSAWKIDDDSAEFTFPALKSWATPQDIAATFESSKRFKNVTPEFMAGGGLRLKARLDQTP